MSSKKKILIVFGTRPEAIKMAPLVLVLQHQNQYEVKVCVTAQHRELLDQVLNLFKIKPDFDLNIMSKGQDLFDITTRVLLEMRTVLNTFKPDLVFVHGDTTTSTATALAAFYSRINVGHIEAGLRTNDIYNPWPEELNRQITGRISTYHFAPTQVSKDNLLKENIDNEHIYITGNTVIDALRLVSSKLDSNNELKEEIQDFIATKGYDVKRLSNHSRKMVLITGHRRENFGEGFLNICQAIKTLADRNPTVDFVYPMHLNPNVRTPINNVFGNEIIDNVFFIEPLEYTPFVLLMNAAHIILTDSGGIQEEAPSLAKPVLVMRTTTERPEALDAGTIKLVGTNKELIINEVEILLNNEEAYAKMSNAINPYGNGYAADEILKIINQL